MYVAGESQHTKQLIFVFSKDPVGCVDSEFEVEDPEELAAEANDGKKGRRIDLEELAAEANDGKKGRRIDLEDVA